MPPSRLGAAEPDRDGAGGGGVGKDPDPSAGASRGPSALHRGEERGRRRGSPAPTPSVPSHFEPLLPRNFFFFFFFAGKHQKSLRGIFFFSLPNFFYFFFFCLHENCRIRPYAERIRHFEKRQPCSFCYLFYIFFVVVANNRDTSSLS